MRAHCSHWLFVGSSLIGHWFVVDWPLAWSLTGEARMFQLDEVGNSKKILIKGKSFKRLTPTNPCFVNVFLSMFCRGEAGVGRLVTPISLTITNVVLPKHTRLARHACAL